MKKTSMMSRTLLISAAMAVSALPSSSIASPYASGVTNVSGTVSFYLNEGGGNVTVTYEDGTTNANFDGITTGTNVPAGKQSFSAAGHNGYAISVTKLGNGTPQQISVDTNVFNLWPSPRGVSVNQNAKYGNVFGRIYVDNSTAGSQNVIFTNTTPPTTNTYSKGRGIYALNSDESEALGKGSTAAGTGAFIVNASSPYHIRVAPDNTLLVGDFSTANANIWQFAPDLTSSNLVFTTTGQTAAAAAGVHGDMFGTPLMTGSLAQGNLVLWTGDGGMAVPNGVLDPAITLGPGTGVGYFNNIYRYDIGAGPLPWNHPPNYAYSVGLSGIAELTVDLDLGKDGKIIAEFGRSNLSNPDVQILDPTGANVLWTSWNDTGGNSDPWRGEATGGNDGGLYGGIRVSPDGRYLAGMDINNGITIANLTNGIPDDASIFGIQNLSATGNARGMGWDAADNIYTVSSGQGLMRTWSLGLTTTCITSNDITGTNGSFQLILPPVNATVVATAPLASQNYINNASPGTPIPGAVTFTLSTNSLPAPLVLNFLLTGSGILNTNYTLGVGTNADNVVITPTNLTFPAGTYPHGGNWSAVVSVTPTAIPVSGPSLTVGFTVLGGVQDLAGSPAKATVSIQNTGPQLLFYTNNISAFGGGVGNTMNRNVPGDYAKFRIIRWGDTNGPGNSASSITPTYYTITNFVYGGTAAFPADYTAQSQRGDPSFDGVLQSPSDGAPGVRVNPGDVTVIAVDGNPVRHANVNAPAVNVTIIINPTNSVTGTNATSSEGYSYSVVPGGVTLTEFDNAIGGEVVLWSDPLTNAFASTNWTLTFASTNFAALPVPPVVLPNYTNDETAINNSGTNDFRVEFGVNTMANDSVPQSAAMVANGWTNALRMTVNKDGEGTVCGVNVFPQNVNFAGNYALRFSMYLSLESSAVGNPYAGTYPFEYALFGVNTTGSNCDWRTSFSVPANPGYAAPTNADGVWFAIDAGYGSITPADFDAFTSPALPNTGIGNDYQSANSLSQNGVFKSPPFASQVTGNTGGGEPVNQWVDVSVEITTHTNVSVFMNRSQVIPSFNMTNSGNYVQGKPMLGYLDPIPNVSDSSAFVYYSNVRIVELAPFIYAHPTSLIVTQGANVSFTSSTWLGTPTITNTWYQASSALTPTLAVQTNTASTTNITSTLSLLNVQLGTNYQVVASDPAGYETGKVASLEVIIPPTNNNVSAGSNFVKFVAIASGPSTPTFQWKTNGVNLVNNTHYAGVTTGTLTITNTELSDAMVYSVAITNAAGGMVLSASLGVSAPQPTFSTVAISGTNALLNFTTANPYDIASGFTLQSCGVVTGPYTNTAGTVTGSAGVFQFKVPYTTNGSMFYRLIHN